MVLLRVERTFYALMLPVVCPWHEWSMFLGPPYPPIPATCGVQLYLMGSVQAQCSKSIFELRLDINGFRQFNVCRSDIYKVPLKDKILGRGGGGGGAENALPFFFIKKASS